MLPSLGYIGGTWADCLEISIDSDFAGVRIRNLDAKPNFVNFRMVLPTKDGKAVSVDSSRISVTQSSNRRNTNLVPHTMQQTSPGVHTGKEYQPWWQAASDVPLNANGIKFFNRRDKWGVRARSISIEILLTTGEWIEVYNSGSVEYRQKVMSELHRIAGELFPECVPTTQATADKWHDDTVHALRDRLDEDPDCMTKNDWLSAACLIPTVSARPLSGDEWRVLAHGLYRQVRRDRNSKSGIASFGGVLHTRATLERLSSEISHVSVKQGDARHTVARHGVVPSGTLRENADDYISTIRALISCLHRLGSQGMLAYGTLLGAVRENDFISHDDDVDLFYTVRPEPGESFEDATLRIEQGLRGFGWKVSGLSGYMNSHVSYHRRSEILDIFPIDISAADVPVHMAQMNVELLPRDWFLDPVSVELRGTSLPAPARFHEFLLARYGESWNQSDPYHDWVWRLDA